MQREQFQTNLGNSEESTPQKKRVSTGLRGFGRACLISLIAPVSAGLLLLAPDAAAQDSLINFNNSVFGTSRLVTDSFGKPVVGTNWVAQLFLDTPTGFLTVSGPGSGLFSAAGAGKIEASKVGGMVDVLNENGDRLASLETNEGGGMVVCRAGGGRARRQTSS